MTSIDTTADGARLARGVRVYTPRDVWGTVRSGNGSGWLVDEDGAPRAKRWAGPELRTEPELAGVGRILDPYPERASARTCQAPRCSNPLPAQRRRFCSDECRRAGHRAERYHETSEFAQMAVRMVRALARRIGAGDAAEFSALWELREAADGAAVLALDELQSRGYSWAEIGAEVGMSKQALSQWRKRRPGGDAVNVTFTTEEEE
jgi:hypothetical protein